jgi:predicted ATP-binding protein involved in virulence
LNPFHTAIIVLNHQLGRTPDNMLKSLNIKKFTVFADTGIEFSSGLNVIIGDNATGKSHLLGLGYSVMRSLYQVTRDNLKQLQIQLEDKLEGVFKPDNLNHLCRHPLSSQPTQIIVNMTDEVGDIQFSFILHDNEIKVDNLPSHFPKQAPLFFPTQEVLTLQPTFTALYENRYLSLPETYYDLCKAFSLPLIKKPPTNIQKIIKPLEKELGGFVIIDKSGRFYLDTPKQGKIEMSLIAEGYRKIAMLVYLILNGSLGKGSTLFWDEAEANLNPKTRVFVINALAALVQNGIQVILSTHDLFMMKQLSLLIETANMPARFFSLRQDNDAITIEQGNVLEDLQTIVTLEEELALYDREQNAYYAKKARQVL